jgi:hypothetical protein
MRTTYGYTPTPNDRFTHVTFKLLDEMLVAARPTNPINIFPFRTSHLPSSQMPLPGHR